MVVVCDRLPVSWPQSEALIPHIQSLTVWQEISDKVKTWLLVANSQFGWYLQSQGHYRDAEKLCI
jgi:hypothetical protein